VSFSVFEVSFSVFEVSFSVFEVSHFFEHIDMTINNRRFFSLQILLQTPLQTFLQNRKKSFSHLWKTPPFFLFFLKEFYY
jgi:hypothetical protein